MMEPIRIFEATVAALLLTSGALSLIAALGLLRLPDFFQRMHAPALASTLGTWCVALASIVNFSVGATIDLRGTVVIILLAVTAPITTTLLARATVFRQRSSAFIDQEQRSWDEHGAGLHNGQQGEKA
jgi:multicomponent K+:H+ antiporter subunit G